MFFISFRLDNLPHRPRTDIVFTDRDTHEQFSDKLRFVFIELPAFSREEQECEADFKQRIYVLKNIETLKRLPFRARRSVFEKLEKTVDTASLSKEERMKYDESIRVYRDSLVTLEFAEQKRCAGGKEETARNLKKMGVSLEIISKVTGLNMEKIEAL